MMFRATTLLRAHTLMVVNVEEELAYSICCQPNEIRRSRKTVRCCPGKLACIYDVASTISFSLSFLSQNIAPCMFGQIIPLPLVLYLSLSPFPYGDFAVSLRRHTALSRLHPRVRKHAGTICTTASVQSLEESSGLRATSSFWRHGESHGLTTVIKRPCLPRGKGNDIASITSQ